MPRLASSRWSWRRQKSLQLAELTHMNRREVITKLAGDFPVRLLCRLLDLSPDSYYYPPRDNDDLAVLSMIEGVSIRFPTYGYRRITAQLRREGHLVNRKRVSRVMRENDLIAVVMHRVRITHSAHGYGRYPNLVSDPGLVRGAVATRASCSRGENASKMSK